MMKPLCSYCFSEIAALLLFSSHVAAVEYWVSKSGSDANPGSKEAAWLTVGKAASIAKSGDLVHVTAGTYDEKVTPASGGDSGAYVTYKGEGSPVIRGFDFTDKSYWAVIGFYFYHPSTAYGYDAIYVNRCTNFAVLDNYFDSINAIHAVISSGVEAGKVNYANLGLIRGNVFYRAGLTVGRTTPAVNLCIGGSNNLIEYNEASQSDDFLRLWGRYNIVRNNYFHDCQPELFSNTPHVDMIQTWDAPNSQPNFDHNLVERNLMASNSNPNGHFYIVQNYHDASAFYETDLTCRKNVAVRTGGVIGIVDNVPNVRDYNNTYVVVRGGLSNNDFCTSVGVNVGGTGTVVPANFVAINNIFQSVCRTDYGKLFSGANLAAPLSSITGNNLSYLSGQSIVPSMGNDVMADPRFVNYSGDDVHLTGGSPAIGAARAQTTTTSSGTASKVVSVRDSGFYTDGWGIPGVTGDMVLVGANAPATITNIDYALNTLTLSTNISWNNGDPVFLAGTQDIGAFNYGAGGYSFGIALTSPRNHANASGSITLTATVTNPTKVRIVRFYLDGIEVGSTAPAASVSVSVPINETKHVVEARAYPLYADKLLASVSSVILNDGLSPSRPANLKILP